jgi:hypothetical protein
MEKFLVSNSSGRFPEGGSEQAKQKAVPLMSARTLRLLKLSIIVMTFLIAAGLVALVFGMKQQMNKLAAKVPVVEIVEFTLPEDAVLRTVAAADETGSVWLHVETGDGQPLLMLIDAEGRLIRTLILN